MKVPARKAIPIAKKTGEVTPRREKRDDAILAKQMETGGSRGGAGAREPRTHLESERRVEAMKNLGDPRPTLATGGIANDASFRDGDAAAAAT